MNPPVYDATWSSEVKALYDHDVREIWDRTLHPHIWNQYHNQLRIYLSLAEQEKRPLRVLDVGCAQGTLALLLAERGHRVVALDLRQQFLDYAKSRYSHGAITFVSANVLDVDLDDQFDLAFANQIIEHLVHPDQLLRRLRSFVVPGGRVVVTTPNWAYVKNSLPTFTQLGDVSQHEHRQFTADGDGHFFAYTAKELQSLFVAAGFADVDVRFFETPIISGHMKLRHVHRFVPVSVLTSLESALLAMPGVSERVSHQLLATGSVAR